tara:strand:- start:60 stop:353 length:294 start_codon:yes stop_codon:yes gene_type:complete
MKKITLLILALFLLNGCVQSTAMLGPSLTAATTGNFFQAGLTYGTNITIEEKTGKTPSEHITNYMDEKEKKKIRKKELRTFLENHIKMAREKLIKKN